MNNPHKYNSDKKPAHWIFRPLRILQATTLKYSTALLSTKIWETKISTSIHPSQDIKPQNHHCHLLEDF